MRFAAIADWDDQKAYPVKLPGWTVLNAVAPSARISANDDVPSTTGPG